MLKDWNPWWVSSVVPQKLLGKERKISRKIYKDMMKVRDFAFGIVGPRRSGKTTIIYQIIDMLIKEGVSPKSILYVNMEDPSLRSLNKIYKEFLEVSKSRANFIFIDEIQEANQWDKWLRSKLDQKNDDVFLFSGSSASLTSDKVMLELAGRCFIKKIFPLSFKEVLEFSKIDLKSSKEQDIAVGLIKNVLKFGLYPRVFFEEDETLKRQILISYFETIIVRDISISYHLDSNKVREVIYYLLRNSGSLVSINKIRRLFRMSYESAEDIISAIKTSMSLIEVRKFSYSLKDQLVSFRKFYPVDLGLRNVVGSPTRDLGMLFESFIAEELVKSNYNVLYWLDKEECDFVVEDKGRPLFAIQVSWKLKESNKKREIKGLLAATKKFKVPGAIITIDNAAEFLNCLEDRNMLADFFRRYKL